MSELVERVARKLHRIEWTGDNGFIAGEFDAQDAEGKKYWHDAARAAIAMVLKAMREPTPEMIKAMNDAIMEHVFCDGYESTGYYAAYEPDDPAAPFKAALAAFTRTALDAGEAS